METKAQFWNAIPIVEITQSFLILLTPKQMILSQKGKHIFTNNKMFLKNKFCSV